MAEIGSGSGSSYPSALDTNTSPEVDSPSVSKTLVRANVPNDLAAAIIALETELGTDPAGSLVDVKSFLQTEHGVSGVHDATKVGMIAGVQTFSGVKSFSSIMKLAKGADVVSSGALTPGNDGNYFVVTGTTTITSIVSKGVGTTLYLRFASALTLTHHATDLILPRGVNITTANGDVFGFIEYASGDWVCIGSNRSELELSLLSITAGYIGADAVITAKIINSAVTGAKISKTIVSQGSQVIAGGGSFTPPAGIYNMVFRDNGANAPALVISLYVSGVWRTSEILTTADGIKGGLMGCYFDGTNMRIDDLDGTSNGTTVYYQTF